MNRDNRVTEDAPLLPANESIRPNPLPWRQLSIVLLAKVCEALASTSRGPYIAQLVSELDVVGGDQKKVGYYLGLLETSYSVIFLMTVLHWNRLSDRIGRKPVFLIGMLGSVVSMLCFGLSRTFWGLIASSSIAALLNANTGVSKSIVGEITDSTNRGQGFAWVVVAAAFGGSIGPLIGGTLAKPSERFPSLFGSHFWRQYPYFLPCLAVSVIKAISFMVTVLFFKESLSRRPTTAGAAEDSFQSTPEKHLPLRQLFTHPVIIAIGNYICLNSLFVAHRSLLTLFFAMPVQIGGLGFDPLVIGSILGAYRGITAIFMAICFPRVIHYMGARRVFILGMCSFLFLWILLPIVNLCASNFGMSASVKFGIGLVLLPEICIEMAEASIAVFVTSAAPSKNSLGAVNGLTQTLGGVACALGSFSATYLFAFSVEHNFLKGYGVYAVLFFVSSFTVRLALSLPDDARPIWERGSSSDEG